VSDGAGRDENGAGPSRAETAACRGAFERAEARAKATGKVRPRALSIPVCE